MSIAERLHQKYGEWAGDCDNDPPNSIIIPANDYFEFIKFMGELEVNKSMPFIWLGEMNVYISKEATEIKIGRLV